MAAHLPASAGPPVIVVEDDSDLLQSLCFSLELEGWPVVPYETAEQLLAGDALLDAGCLVLDQMLPGTSGLDLLSHVRARGLGLPVIIITTNPGSNMRARAAAHGASIVEKPLLGGVLIEAIQRVLTPQNAGCR